MKTMDKHEKYEKYNGHQLLTMEKYRIISETRGESKVQGRGELPSYYNLLVHSTHHQNLHSQRVIKYHSHYALLQLLLPRGIRVH